MDIRRLRYSGCRVGRAGKSKLFRPQWGALRQDVAAQSL